MKWRAIPVEIAAFFAISTGIAGENPAQKPLDSAGQINQIYI
jgi:hypothetical protein